MRFEKFAAIVLIMQALTTTAILMDIAVVRQVLGFICFIVLLGLVTIPLLNIRSTSKTEVLLYSVGLGLVLLMIIGLVVNATYPFIKEPLATLPMLIALNLYMVAALVAGIIFRLESPIPRTEEAETEEVAPRKDIKNTIYGALIVAFPAVAIIGTWAMNIGGSNLILMGMILSMGVLFVALLIDRKVPEGLYPLFILSASISLLFLYSLRSFYLLGFDIHGEFYTYELTLANYHWAMENYQHIYNSCLSITILPVVLQSLLNISGEYLFKLMFQVIFAIMPLALYMFFKEKVGTKMAYLAAFFMMSHYMFMYQMPALVRQEVSILLFVLAVFILFTDRISKPGGMALFILFSLGTVVSHYTTSFLYLIILMVTAFMGWYMKMSRMPIDRKVTGKIVLALFLMVIIWHGLISKVTLSAAITFGITTLTSFNEMLIGSSAEQAPIASQVLGKGIDTMLPKMISFGVGTLSRILVVLGVIYVVSRTLIKRENREAPSWMKFDAEYVLASMFLIAMVVASIFIPFVSVGYNLERIYMQSLIFLAPMCAIGLLAIFRNIKLDTAVGATSLIVAVFFLCQTGFTYQIFDVPESISLNPDTDGGYLVYPHEVESAKWLTINEPVTTVYADNYGSLRLWSYGGLPRGYGFDKGVYKLDTEGYNFRTTRYNLLNSYVYLDYYNIKNGLIFDGWGMKRTPISELTYLNRMDAIYDNGGSAILKRSGRGL